MKTGSCVYENQNACSQVSGINILPDPEYFGTCTTEGVVRPSSICSDYLRCENSQWRSYSCNTNYYYDNTTESCVVRSNAKTYDCDRCQFSNNQFVNAVDTECRKYLVCQNGVRKSINTCGVGYYFDEVVEACIQGNGRNSQVTNSACFVASGTSDTTSPSTIVDDTSNISELITPIPPNGTTTTTSTIVTVTNE